MFYYQMTESEIESCIAENRAYRLVVQILICFCKQQLLLAKINQVIYFSQSQMLLVKTNEDQTTSRKALLIHLRPRNLQK